MCLKMTIMIMIIIIIIIIIIIMASSWRYQPNDSQSLSIHYWLHFRFFTEM